MLKYLERLGDSIFFELFSYPEFRALGAILSAFLLAVLFGRWFIPYLQGRRILETVKKGDSARLDSLHGSKESTPTMGGVILLFGMTVSTLLWADLSNRFVPLLLLFTCAYGAIGWVDDWTKLKGGKKGISARTKLLLQVSVSTAVGAYLYANPLGVQYGWGDGELGTALFFPFFKEWIVPLGLFYIAFVVLVTTATSNAVNLTDGLDGLAIGCTVLASLTFGVIAFLCGHETTSNLLSIPFIAEAAELVVFLGALFGAGMGFLWFNCHPARIFMGDTGSLALGGALGLVAVLCKQELLLVLVGGVLVIEALSVVLQVASFKLLGRRIFLIAPLHHHFQFKGWKETKVTVRFWIVAAVCSVLSLVTLKIR